MDDFIIVEWLQIEYARDYQAWHTVEDMTIGLNGVYRERDIALAVQRLEAMTYIRARADTYRYKNEALPDNPEYYELSDYDDDVLLETQSDEPYKRSWSQYDHAEWSALQEAVQIELDTR